MSNPPALSWQTVLREGFFPQFKDAGLAALRAALERDSPDLLQGATTRPPPLECVQDWPVEAACPVTYVGWKGDSLACVAEAEEFFARVCYEADQRLGAPAACRFFLNWVDETPRAAMRHALLAEVVAEQARRTTNAVAVGVRR